jgi:hypothetical protein
VEKIEISAKDAKDAKKEDGSKDFYPQRTQKTLKFVGGRRAGERDDVLWY